MTFIRIPVLLILMAAVLLSEKSFSQQAPLGCDSCAVLKGQITDTFTKEPIKNAELFYDNGVLTKTAIHRSKTEPWYYIIRDSINPAVKKYFTLTTELLVNSDDAGKYKINMLPGKYIIIAQDVCRYTPVYKTIELKPKEEKVLNIDLPGEEYMQFPDKSRAASGEDPFIDWGRYYIASLYGIKTKQYYISLDLIKDEVLFKGYVESPLKHSRFYRYDHHLFQSLTHSLLCRYDDTLLFIPPSTPDNFSHRVIDSSSIAFINERLQKEPDFYSDQVKELAMFYYRLATLGEGKPLNTWKDIDYDEGDVVTMELKKTIQPPRFIYTDSGYHLVFYTHINNILQEVNFIYRNKRISVTSKSLGTYGKMYGYL